MYVHITIVLNEKRGKYRVEVHTSILGEVNNVEISRATQQLLNGKFHDFLAVFPRAHSKINLNCKIFE